MRRARRHLNVSRIIILKVLGELIQTENVDKAETTYSQYFRPSCGVETVTLFALSHINC